MRESLRVDHGMHKIDDMKQFDIRFKSICLIAYNSLLSHERQTTIFTNPAEPT